MCQLLQPWGYGELAFPVINIQRDSHLESTSALLRFGIIYLFFFLFDFFALGSLFPISICFFLLGYVTAIF